MDHLTKERRSWNMSRIRSKNTKPELIVRSVLHKAGYRFRLNGKISRKIYEKGVLPGKPDIVLPKYKIAIFVHGCFWHRHQGCKKCTTPSTNVEYWNEKFNKNSLRDAENIKRLKEIKWIPLVLWECEIKTSPIKVVESAMRHIQSIIKSQTYLTKNA